MSKCETEAWNVMPRKKQGSSGFDPRLARDPDAFPLKLEATSDADVKALLRLSVTVTRPTVIADRNIVSCTKQHCESIP